MRSRTLVIVTAAWLVVALGATAEARHRPRGWFGMSLSLGPLWLSGAGPLAPEAVPPSGVRPDLAVVDTDVSPEAALVVLDGRVIGTADDFDGYPGYLYLEPGHYTLEFQLGGYRSQVLQLDAAAGRTYPLDLDLERVPGEAVQPWWDRPDGLPVGRVFAPARPTSPEAPAPGSPERGPDPSLRPELSRPGGPTHREGAPVPSGAALQLEVTPAGASVYLDGTFVGTGSELASLQRGLSVAPGRHRLEAMAPGYRNRVVDVDVAAGGERQVIVELEREAGQTGPGDVD